MVKNKCNGCTERKVGCQNVKTCNSYREYREEIDRISNVKLIEKNYYGYLNKTIDKAYKHRQQHCINT